MFLNGNDFDRRFTPGIVDFFVAVTAAGRGEKSLEILDESSRAEHLEPLIVAMQKHLKMRTNAPLEIYEVARDIVAEIDRRKSVERDRWVRG